MQETPDVASSLCRNSGRLVIAGLHHNGTRTVDLESWNRRALDIVNAHERDLRAYVRGLREGVAAAADGRIELEPLLTHSCRSNALTTSSSPCAPDRRAS